MKKELNDAEERLLNHKSLDELIKLKMEEEMQAEIAKSKLPPEKKILTQISDVPQNMIFSRQSVFKVFNRKNKTETFINGVQAEAMLGVQTLVKEKIKTGITDTFSTENLYVKFEKIEM
jgi:hypothetical protein